MRESGISLPDGVLSELLYDDLVLMSQRIEGVRNKFSDGVLSELLYDDLVLMSQGIEGVRNKFARRCAK